MSVCYFLLLEESAVLMNGEAVHLSFGTRPELKMQINCWNFSDKYVLGDNLLSTSGFLQKASV